MHSRETMIFHFGFSSANLWTFVIEIYSQAISKAPGFPIFCNYLFKPLQGCTWLVSPGWRAQRRDLTWRMCPCPPACWNVINAPHIEPSEEITFVQHVSTMCPWEMVGRCPFEWRPFSIELSCSIQATDLQERESSTRVVGREARLGFCLLIAFNPLAIFSFILSSYFCFLVPFNILIPCYILISAFSLRSKFFSHFHRV